MRIALVNGQNHKGSTYHIGRILAEALGKEGEITEIFLPRDFPHFCTGCAQCFTTTETACPHAQALRPLTKIMDQAELLIFTSPVYVYHVTGSMKAFLDHYGYRWMVHRPAAGMFQKQAVVIATAAGGGMKSTCKDLADSCFFWGVAKTYCYGVGVAAISWDGVKKKKKEAIQKRVDALAQAIRKRAGKIRPNLKTKSFFHIMRKIYQGGKMSPADQKYWIEQGWTVSTRPWL